MRAVMLDVLGAAASFEVQHASFQTAKQNRKEGEIWEDPA